MGAGSEAVVTVRRFGGEDGGEQFFAVQARGEGDFASQLAAVVHAYDDAVRAAGLAPESAVLRRVLVSDIANQADAVRASPLVRDPAAGPVALSLVQQPPLPAGRIALLAYHLQGSFEKRRLSPHLVAVTKAGRRHLWTTGVTSGRDAPAVDAAAETAAVFGTLIADLAAQGGTLARDCQRTWLYVKGVDVFYQDLVARRTALFASHGLGRQTHSIASTAIEGACGGRYEVVGLDAYSVLGLRPEQVRYLHAPELIGATYDYGVTFERGTCIGYADRVQCFLSGTASIDPEGNVVHRGDVGRQLERALANAEALLRSGGAGLGDLLHLVAYVRDAADSARVAAALRALCPGVPCLVVLAPVCRPEWLVEVEGIAVAAAARPDLPRF
jgi:enamine deaminase RidA (YjgF/YER057c/UK114 family)